MEFPAHRKLLQDTHHCSGGDTLMGGVNVAGSAVILILIGFVVGGTLSWFIMWRRERRRYQIEMEYRHRYAGEIQQQYPDVSEMVKAAHTPTIKSPVGSRQASAKMSRKTSQAASAAAAAAAAGPLAKGAAASERAAGGQGTVSTSSEGVEGYTCVQRNPVCSLNNTPSPSGPGGQRQSLIGAALYPPSDPASPLMGAAAGNGSSSREPPTYSWAAASLDAAPPHQAALLGASAVGAPQHHARMQTVMDAPSAAATSASSDYAAALGRAAPDASASSNPFMQQGGGAPAATAQPGNTTKSAHKAELLQAVREEEYAAEDLDEEWAALLQDLDARLQAGGKPRLSSRERAVAIRSLIVATASQSAEAALAKAAADVDGFRRVQTFRQK